MIYPLVRDLAAAGAPVQVPVAVTCRVLKIARQPYYRWLTAPVADADWVEAHRANALFDAYPENLEVGYRLLVDEARKTGGQVMADRTAWRICSANGWWSVFGKPNAYAKARRAGAPTHGDLVAHDFTADEPNRLWLIDITEHSTGAGKLYPCAIKDVWSSRIVGYSIDSRMKSRLAVAALENAVARRATDGLSSAGCVVHSDRGSQGGFNRSSQHLVITQVFDGSSTASSRPRDPCEVEVARSSEVQRRVEVAFWQQIAKGLLPEEAAGIAGVAQAVGARWFQNAGGMPPFEINKQPSGRYLSFAEREEIALLKAQNQGVMDIARAIGRDPGTVSRELRRNAATEL